MPKPIIECVPNFSEGRDAQKIEAIVAPFRKQTGCTLLDYRADRNHNRLVVSLVGQPDPIQEALLASAQVAVEKIDMNMHQGGHPRIGAIDVIPFIPIQNIQMPQCVELSRNFAKQFNQHTGIPVYLYEDAAVNPERQRLEVIRKGQYEALQSEIAQPERLPDVGEAKLHPTAGATVIGARKFLIAFNVNLGTADVAIAREIAGAVRTSSGGLAHVKGIGLLLEDRGISQVSMNIVDYEKNALYRVVELIRMEARRWGVTVLETEVYGMVPAKALLESAAYYLQIADFDPSQVIELAMLNSMD